MIINENDIVNEDNNENIDNTVVDSKEEENETVVDSDSSDDTKKLSIEDMNVENSNDTILDYLDPKILEVKEYTYDEINTNIENKDKDVNSDENDDI